MDWIYIPDRLCFFLDRPWICFCIDHEFFHGSTRDFFLSDNEIFSGSTIELFSGSIMDFFWIDHTFYLDRPWNMF